MLRVSKGLKIKCGVLMASFFMMTAGNAAVIYAEGEDVQPEDSGEVYVEETWEETGESQEASWEGTSEETYEETSEETWTDETVEETSEEWSEEAYTEETVEEASGEEGEEDSDLEEDEEEETQQETSQDGPVIKGSAGLVYCRTTGEIVYGKNIDTKLSPYSITKLVTVFLAVQRLDPAKEVTISAEAAAQGGATLNLQEGEVLTAEQLMYGTMLVSGNDAAYALGEAVTGDMESFLKLMNDTVEDIGCKNTHFESPSGLINDLSRHYTTCKDMLEIAKVVFSNNKVKEIAGTRKYEMPATEFSEARTMESHVKLFDKPGYVAGKTGWWEIPDEATMVIDYEKDGLEFIAVVMGSVLAERENDCEKMINYANKVVEGITVVKKGDFAGKVRIRHGEITTIDSFIAEDSLVYLPKQGSMELISQSVEIRTDVEAPVKKGDSVGTCKIYVAGEVVDQVDVIAGESVDVGWLPSYVGISNRNTMIILGVIGLLLLLLLMSMVHRIQRRRKQRIERRHRIREMAEEELLRDKRRGGRY